MLSAPGAVIATSNKADLWAAAAEVRAASGSGVWVFDPQHITAAGQRWWWNPLAGLTSVEAAHRFASHFVLTIDDESKRDIWPGPLPRTADQPAAGRRRVAAHLAGGVPVAG